MIDQRRLKQAIRYVFLFPPRDYTWKGGRLRIISEGKDRLRIVYLDLPEKEYLIFRFLKRKPDGEFYTEIFHREMSAEDAVDELIKAVRACIGSLPELERAELLAKALS